MNRHTLIRDIKVIKLGSFLRLEFNIDFKHQGVLCMLKHTILNVESQQL